ncbi:MAG: UvrD-helicase domain-containing protein [Ghiorsea sp.]|nr:UvrD-helicase domain-containing protein [Ghiorsea sp.]
MTRIIDQKEREQAISPNLSYVVQAPAGSGKTELLIQRILGLLAIVNDPEEILALTFTRKAAAEMRERVLKALYAAQKPQPQENHALTTWTLARTALNRAEVMAWNLPDYPARLRIMTLDAFASGLARQLPILSGFGQTPATSDHAEPVYIQAAEDLLQYSTQKQAPTNLKQAINTLILHQNCNIEKLKSLLASMLSRREQWLPDVFKYSPDMPSFRQVLEDSLQTIIEHTIHEFEQHISSQQKHEIVRLANFAAAQLSISLNTTEHALSPFLTQTTFPQVCVNDVTVWKAMVYLLTSGIGSRTAFRKRVDKRQGFPTSDEGKCNKQALTELIRQLQAQPDTLNQLIAIQSLPDTHHFDDQAWHTLESLFIVLKMLAAQLWQTFEQHKQVDFVEIMLKAKQALGEDDEHDNIIPSDALLRLDYQIKHILIDEFQDTSSLQVDLLARLTAGWNDDSGRTLFMVGDPMQSIYRFRKAEVSLFLQATQNTLPIPQVTSLTLAQNFRSSSTIVDWLNQAFESILPAQHDVLSGAIAYTPCTAFKTEKGLVSLNILTEKSEQQEADLIVGIIQQAKGKGKRVGVLARSRSHLKTLMKNLQTADIPFKALDVLPLHQQPEIIDLLNLTSALLHAADHTAWASLLRSPMLGLKLDDLFSIFNQKPLSPWQAIQSYTATTTDEHEKLQSFIQAVSPAITHVRRIPLRKLVESTWLRLNGSASISHVQLSHVDVFLNLLEKLDEGGQVDTTLLQQHLQKLYAKPENKTFADQVELLTMHGAKGLQWDTVILCGLGKTPRAKDKDVLVQTETHTHQGKRLLLSPMPQHGKDPSYELIRGFEKQRDDLEIARLLYVACTRAERELHMFGEVSDSNQQPKSSSLLARLYQEDQTCFQAEIIHHDHAKQHTVQNNQQAKAQCLPLDFVAPKPFASIQSQQSHDDTLQQNNKPAFNWASAQARAVGIAFHAALQCITAQGLKAANEQSLMKMMHHILYQEGISNTYIQQALSRCQYGLKQCFTSPRLAWLLSDTHQDKRSEWALTYVEGQQCKHVILDYSFIDNQGTRWVVDYKTGSHFDADVDHFLDQELHRYTVETPQLPKYVQVLQALEPERTIKAALYFPMLDGWREWQ